MDSINLTTNEEIVLRKVLANMAETKCGDPGATHYLGCPCGIKQLVDALDARTAELRESERVMREALEEVCNYASWLRGAVISQESISPIDAQDTLDVILRGRAALAAQEQGG